MNEEVSQFIEKLPSWQIEICNQLRKIALDTIPDATERMQYGKPHYLKDKSYACVISTAKDKVSFTIFNATALEEVGNYFKATTSPDRKTATIKQGSSVNYAELSEWLQKAASTL